MAEPTVTESVSSVETRNSKSANQSFNQLLLVVALVGVVLWLAPPVRVVAAIPLQLAGQLFLSASQSMNQHPAQSLAPNATLSSAATVSGSSDWSWILGFALLALPFVLYRGSYIQGWLQGTKDAGSEWHEFHSIRHR